MKTENEKKKNQEKKNQNKPSTSDYAKYLGLGFQIVATMILGILVGLALDDHFKTTTPVYTIICASLAIVIAIYQLIKPYLPK